MIMVTIIISVFDVRAVKYKYPSRAYMCCLIQTCLN